MALARRFVSLLVVSGLAGAAIAAGPGAGSRVRSYGLTAPAGQGAQLRFASSEDPTRTGGRP
jgi:hypothetical protein